MDNAQIIRNAVREKAQIITGLNRSVWEYAELGYQETKSAAAIIKALEDDGFTVTKELAGIPTAFKAVWGSGSPVVGILGEYDALPGLSQKAGVAAPEPDEGHTTGHGCGHCALGAGAVGAAMAAKAYLEQSKKPGTLVFFGCPAEEQGFGKGFMAKARCFDGVDMMFTWHPADQNVPMGTRMVANYKVRFDFTGISAHAGAAPEKGRSALDACELMNVGVNYMREHVISDARIHYAYLDNGGEAPNVVQDHASLLYFMRAPKLAQSSEILARIKKIAQGAALMTETEVKVRVLGGLSDVIPNPTAFQVLSDAYVEMGGPEFDEEDYAIARKFLAILPEDAKKAMVQKMAVLHKITPEEFEKRPLNSVVIPYSPLMRQKVLTASSDVGDVSYLVPTAQLTASAAIPGTGHHTWQYTAQVGTSIGGKACLAAAKAIGLACTRIFDDPALADQAKKELLEETGGVENTNIVLLGDHGQLYCDEMFHLNALFHRLGWLQTAEDGSLADYQVYAANCSLSAHIYLRPEVDREMVYCVLLEQQKKYPKYLERIFTKEEAAQMHLTGDFDFVIEAGDRVCFGRALDGEQLITSVNDIKEYKPSVSTHGHLPWKGDKPPFIVAGPNAVSGRIIHGGRLIDHAPTILRLLGLEPIGMDGHPVDALVRP